LALHALDEAAHHGAELGVLRDLWLHGFSEKQLRPEPDPNAGPTARHSR
jgi:hypothetical protein